MALGPTSFMTAPGVFGTGQEKIDVSDVLAAALLKDTTFLGEVPLTGTAKNIEHRWLEDSLNAVFVTGTFAVAGNVLTITAPATTPDVLNIVRRFGVVRPEGRDFYLQFGADPVTGANTMTPYGNTTPVAITVATRFIVAALPKRDIDPVSADISSGRVIRRNFTQVFERGVWVEESRKHIELHAVADELKLQIEKRTMEVKQELNRAIVIGIPTFVGGVFTGDLQERTMAGVLQQIRNPDMGTANTDRTAVTVNGALTELVLNELAFRMWELGGLQDDSDPIIVVGARQARAVSAFNRERLRVDESNRVAGWYINRYMTDLGKEMPIIRDRWVPADMLFIVDKKRIQLMPLGGDAWGIKEKPSQGRHQMWQISGQYTLRVSNADACHGALLRLT